MKKSNILLFGNKEIYDTYDICYGVVIENTKDWIIYDLYYELRDYGIGLNYFFYQTITEKEFEEIKDDKEKQIDVTLEYLYPLLRDGKLEVRVGDYKVIIGENGEKIYKDLLYEKNIQRKKQKKLYRILKKNG